MVASEIIDFRKLEMLPPSDMLGRTLSKDNIGMKKETANQKKRSCNAEGCPLDPPVSGKLSPL